MKKICAPFPSIFIGIKFMLYLSINAQAAEPIVIGVPTAMKQAEAIDSFRSAQLAVEEINAKGGVSVGGEKRLFHVVSMDTAGERPGIPIHDILAGVEKLILEKKPHAIVVGAYRSESFLAEMDLVSTEYCALPEAVILTPGSPTAFRRCQRQTN